jgi:hypothetical protein
MSITPPKDQSIDTEDVVGLIMAYENGDLDVYDTIDLFGHLVAVGAAWSLQGSYGRTAQALIEAGYIDTDGIVVAYPESD